MTTTKIYNCNLCRDKIDEKNQGVGIQFMGASSLKRVAVAVAENHICLSCLKQLQAIEVQK